MGNKILAIGALAFMSSVVAMSVAQASVKVTVWGSDYQGTNYSPVSSQTLSDAAAPPPALSWSTAPFTYNGPIDWVNNSSNNGQNFNANLFGQFLNGADITSFSSNKGLGSPSSLVLSTWVPEPSTWAMMLVGIVGLSYAGFRSRRRTAISIV
ncbi:MAG TPA: PEP-CTERM sorting domain-containing protein [Roseiarcus sp.]|nr:PEP-CTERM sorting domain-containing protein [Roseiarcus sp.]